MAIHIPQKQKTILPNGIGKIWQAMLGNFNRRSVTTVSTSITVSARTRLAVTPPSTQPPQTVHLTHKPAFRSPHHEERSNEQSRIGISPDQSPEHRTSPYHEAVRQDQQPCPCPCRCNRKYGADTVFAQQCHHCLFHHTTYELALVASATRCNHPPSILPAAD